ncbi:hypothetical protein QBC35DRAFT_189560 [Podospora australis]|uniref:Uncharacterized protein n=1 Tax=Podospora australis TaxID=1536484 RepID=A0AAN6WW29_9PEZI|nr:hypothetical protein QBC35DRAFT_189560 [Podospora australis]
MAIKSWMSGLLLAGSLASALPSNAPRQSSADAATIFVNELIANATAEDHPDKRALTCGQNSNLVVDTGYAKYRGYSDAATGLNHWKG